MHDPNAEVRVYRHKLSSCLISGLLKFHRAVKAHGRNDLHLRKDVKQPGMPWRLTDDEWTNFTKLRFHGLVAHKKWEGTIQRGRWVITTRGADFINNRVKVPDWVKTAGNKVLEGSIGHSQRLVSINDFRDVLPDFAGVSTLEQTEAPGPVQASLSYSQPQT